LLTYSKVGGSFEAVAAFDAVPHSSISQGAIEKAYSYGAYSKILPIPTFTNTSDYYILISS
jgi:hypothetical protein